MATEGDNMERVEMADKPARDGEAGTMAGHHTAELHRRPTQSIPAGAGKTSKCAFCRKDHKKCVRMSENEKCDRCKTLNYSCFGGLESARAGSPKRVLNRNKCDYCRDAKQKCLPVDRVWPDVCDRCKERGLPCSESGSPRKRSRIGNSPAASAHVSTGEAHRYSQSVESIVTNEATSPEIRPSSLDRGDNQTQSMVNKTNQQSPMRGTSDDSNLAMLSNVAATYRIDNLPWALQNTKDSYSYNGMNFYQRAMARDRWKQALDKIRRAIRFRNITSILLFAPQPDGIVLCNVCVGLGLSRESFIVDSKDRHNRLKRDPISLEDRLWRAAKEGTAIPFPLEETNLGNLGTIRKRGHICSFCRLVWNSARDQVKNSETAKIGGMMAYATWQIDGRQLLPSGSGKLSSAKPRNRRIRLQWRREPARDFQKSGMVLNDAFIIMVADSKRSWDSNFLGRPIEIGRSITTLARDWVENCQNHHLNCNEMISGNTIDSGEYDDFLDAVGHNFKLVDVVHMRTVPPSNATRHYAALSYAWAREQNFYFGAADVEKFEQLGERGGVERIFSQLPHTIQDAIELVKALDFRYLWVDVLCTIYDASTWDHRGMAQIFSNAFLTICAADDRGHDGKLVALHMPREPLVQHIEKCAPGLELMVLHPAEKYINQSLWSRRGWTFQERFLSRRCLIFAEGRVFWECRDATASEDIVEHSREPSWSIDMLYNPLHSIGDLHEPSQGIRAYMRYVEAYTLRELSLPEDILAGFEGVGALIETSLKTNLLYGLPSSFLDFALLWEFQTAPGVNQRRQSPDLREFPTWSWSGWEAAVTYRSSTTSGTLTNIMEWISQHTWISWYVRDRYSILRLLHKVGQEPITVQRQSKLDSSILTVKVEDRRLPSSMQWSSQPHHQQPVKWPGQNRSSFFKSVPNLQVDTMDIDNESPEDFDRRDTKYLQFWTWSGFFRLRDCPPDRSSNLAPGLSRFSVLDNNDDFCGTAILSDNWVLEKPIDAVYEMVAISEAKDFTPEEFNGWTYYINKERDESEWDLWYVLIVDKVDNVVVKRMGLGKVFQEAFENSCSPGKDWREFIMA